MTKFKHKKRKIRNIILKILEDKLRIEKTV